MFAGASVLEHSKNAMVVGGVSERVRESELYLYVTHLRVSSGAAR